MNDAIAALGALAHETRLSAFRLLVRAGPAGAAAGEIARLLDIPAATMSFHLAHLARAGLIAPTRDGRSIIYTADFAGMRDLIDYLSEDCCAGWPEPPATEDATETMAVEG